MRERKELEDLVKATKKEFEFKELVRPDFWGGYLVKPVSIEFWQGRSSRLHDRLLYQLGKESNWSIVRLAP